MSEFKLEYTSFVSVYLCTFWSLCKHLSASVCLLVSVHTCPSVCLIQHHESVELATAETSKAGLRAFSFWLVGSLCCSWEREEKREQTLLLLLLLSSILSHSVVPSSCPCFFFVFFFSSLHLSLPFFSLSFTVLSYAALPPSLPLYSICSLFISSPSLGLLLL